MNNLPILPPGIFSVLLDLWTMVRYTYVGVLEAFTKSFTVTIGTNEWSLLSLVAGSGLSFFIGFLILKRVIK